MLCAGHPETPRGLRGRQRLSEARVLLGREMLGGGGGMAIGAGGLRGRERPTERGEEQSTPG